MPTTQWQTHNEKLIPLTGGLQIHSVAVQKPNLCFAGYHLSLDLELFSCFPTIMQLCLCGIVTLSV